MPALAKSMRRFGARALRRVGRHIGIRRDTRRTDAHFRLVTDERRLARAAYLLAHYGSGSPVVIQRVLSELWDLESTTLYVQLDGAASTAELVLRRCPGDRVIATGQDFRAETQTHEPAPDGAYLVERQYRTLGLYENPPCEQTIVALRIAAGAGRTYLVDIPSHVSHVSVVATGRTLGAAVLLPAEGEIRYVTAAMPIHRYATGT